MRLAQTLKSQKLKIKEYQVLSHNADYFFQTKHIIQKMFI